MKQIITLKREINTTKELKDYLELNMRQRNFIYNKGIEYAKNHNDRFSSYTFDTYFRKEFREKDINKDIYATDTIQETCSDVQQAVNAVWKNRKDGKFSDLKFHKFNLYSQSFRMYNKAFNKVKFKSNGLTKKGNHVYEVFIKFNKNYHFDIKLKEPLQNRKKNLLLVDKNVKTISFIKKNDKYFICLAIEVECVTNMKRKRDDLAGIDLGLQNPVVLYDGNKHYKFKFPHHKIKKLECKLDNMNQMLSKKVYNSNNYNKLLKKIQKIYVKMTNIRKDWRYKVAYYIVNNYKVIVVDNFEVPIVDEFDNKTNQRINRRDTSICMSLFMKCLKYMVKKYKTKYIEAEPLTTRTCSYCGHINPKLELSKRKLTCEKCNRTIDRDENAAINCYNQY